MAMTMDKAVEILGTNRTRSGDLTPMIRALGMFPFLNTPQETERREAAQYLVRRWSAYQNVCYAARDARVR